MSNLFSTPGSGARSGNVFDSSNNNKESNQIFFGNRSDNNLRQRKSKGTFEFAANGKAETTTTTLTKNTNTPEENELDIPKAVSLFDLGNTPNDPPSTVTTSQIVEKQSTNIGGPDLGIVTTDSAFIEDFGTDGTGESPWVTVFGFPSGYGAAVLRYFQEFGEVHEHRSEPGNWMHILYASKIQAGRALTSNGRFIPIGNENIMIGVKPCHDPIFENAAPSRRKSKPAVRNEKYNVVKPVEVNHRPRQVSSICSRICAWILDW